MIPVFEGMTLGARSFRDTALLVLEEKLSVDTLFREFSDRYLKSAGMEKRMTGGSRRRGDGLNRQKPTQDTTSKRRDHRKGSFEFVRSYSDAVRTA